MIICFRKIQTKPNSSQHSFAFTQRNNSGNKKSVEEILEENKRKRIEKLKAKEHEYISKACKAVIKEKIRNQTLDAQHNNQFNTVRVYQSYTDLNPSFKNPNSKNEKSKTSVKCSRKELLKQRHIIREFNDDI